MKKTLITLAAVAATGVAFAQSTVTISGSVAAAYERNTLANNEAGITGYDAGNNNVTFKGTEDLGGGLKISFELNKRFNPDTGTTNGREFENSFITLAGGFGEVKMGRHQAISVAAFDINNGAGTDQNTNLSTVGRDYGYNNVSGSRYNDAISYTTPKFAGFSATVVTTFSPETNLGREASAARLAYAKGPLSAAYVIEQVADTTVDGIAGRRDQNLGVSYDFGVAKALLLWGKEGDGEARTEIGAIVPLGSAVKLRAAYRTKGETVSATTARVGDPTKGKKTITTAAWALGADYSLSKRTTLFADFGDYENSAQSAYRIGVKHTF